MHTRIVRNSYTPNALKERWGNYVWEHAPALILTIPFPGGVLFGAEGQGHTQRVGFYLEPGDARIVAAQFLKAANEAENDFA